MKTITIETNWLAICVSILLSMLFGFGLVLIHLRLVKEAGVQTNKEWLEEINQRELIIPNTSGSFRWKEEE